MAYSAKKYWTLGGGALALGLSGGALVIWLSRNHTDPISLALLRGTLSLIVVGLGMRAYRYADEVQRQIGQKLWFLGSMISFAVLFPVVVALQTEKAWLDSAVQFIFRHPALPRLYFTLGVMLPVLFQVVSVLVLKLLDKLSRGSQS